MVSPRILENKSFLIWIFCFLVAVTDYAVLSGPVLSKDVARGVDYLIRFGYLVQKDPRTGSLRTRAELERSVKMLQRYAGLPETGVLDAATIKLMGQSRCGVSDFGKSDNARRKRRYFLQGTWWKKTDLTYKINSYSRDLPNDQQEAAFRQAFSLWSAVTPLNIQEVHGVPDDKVDILISFGSGYHGDPYPFDGNGGTLAHAYYPHNNLGLSGDAHFDDDERFTTGIKDGINLDWVAVHEFGHSLGLEHSNVRESIMYPWYKGYVPNIKLTYDDIQGIQALYGRVNNPTTPATRKPVEPRTRSTTSPPDVDVCSVSSYDTLFIGGDSKTYAFYEEYYWVISSSTGVEKGPLKISNKWPDLKTPVDAAYTRLDGNTVFFRGSQFWQYKGDTLDKGPRPISEYGLSSEMRDMDAVFVWGRNRRTYFFKGTKYWRYDDTNNRVDYGYPRNITVWKGVSSNINAAMKWVNEKTYFFKGRKYVRLDDWKIEVERQYPKSIAVEWMSCEKENLNQPTERVMETSRDQSNSTDSTDPKNASTAVAALPSLMMFTLYSVVAMTWLV